MTGSESGSPCLIVETATKGNYSYNDICGVCPFSPPSVTAQSHWATQDRAAMNVTQEQEDTLVPELYSLRISPLQKPSRRFDQLPIGLNQRPPAYSVPFRGQDDEPGVPLYKFLDMGNRQSHADEREKGCEDARYCVDLNKPLGDTFNKNTKYFNILAKLEVCAPHLRPVALVIGAHFALQWPGYESSGDFLCDCGSGTTRYEIGREFARVWRDYMSVSRREVESTQSIC